MSTASWSDLAERLNGALSLATPPLAITFAAAVPGLRIEGKPQCHIVAIAKDQGEVAASVGCALSRVRTGMAATEMTCAIPAAKLGEVVAAIERNAVADAAVARYAAEDAQRFA